jgi:NodT family efflux transporter outer membrane factor (OMF) lipoprotein
MHDRCRFAVSLCLSIALLTGCKVGPNFRGPPSSVSGNWIDAYHPRLAGQLDNPQQWWIAFGDLELNNLIHSAVEQNLTLKQAGLRVAEARYRRKIAAGEWFAQTQTAGAGYEFRQRSRNNANFAQGGPLRSFDQFDFGLGCAWEIDVWGRFRRSVEAADGELNASAAAYDDVLVILLADVANAYIELRTLEGRIQLASENVNIQKETVALVERKLAAGLVSELDAAQSKTNLYQTQARIPELNRQHRQASNLLCILMGMAPSDLSTAMGRTGKIPEPLPEIAVGIPADLVRQSPDVRQAEQLLAAQSARIGVAKADLYPHLSIAGTFKFESQDLSNLVQSGSLAGSVGPNVRWDILNYGRIKNNVLLQNTIYQRLCHAYQQSILEASREVEDGLATFINKHNEISLLEQAKEASIRSVELALLQYHAGTVDFNRVLQAQIEQVRTQDQLAIAKGELAQGLVSVYRALGGGWQLRLNSTSGDSCHVANFPG